MNRGVVLYIIGGLVFFLVVLLLLLTFASNESDEAGIDSLPIDIVDWNSNIDENAPICLTCDLTTDEMNPAWTGDGRIVFTLNDGKSDNLWIMDKDGRNKRKLTDNSDYDSTNRPGNVVCNKNLVFSTNLFGNDEIAVMDLSTKNIKRITRDEDKTDWEPSWSSDCTEIVYQSMEAKEESTELFKKTGDGDDITNKYNNWDIFKMKADGSDVSRLTFSRADDMQPSYGREKIIYQSLNNNDWDVWMMDENGNKKRDITNSFSEDTDASWAPDEKFIVLSSTYGHSDVENYDGNGPGVDGNVGSDEAEIYLFELDTGRWTRITDNNFYDGAPSINSDGRNVVYESNVSGNMDIYTKKINLKPTLIDVDSFVNAYDIKESDFNKLKDYSVVIIDADGVEGDVKNLVNNLKNEGVIVFAYINLGYAEDFRDYWEGMDKSIVLGESQEFDGEYGVSINDDIWHDTIVDVEIPQILAKADFDGLVLDNIDVAENVLYKTGMYKLIKRIRETYLDLLLVPNRGFNVLNSISKLIDGIKYEGMCSAYDENLGKYVYVNNLEEDKILFSVLEKNSMPVLVLDHVETNPKNVVMASGCFEKLNKLKRDTGYNFVWYGNSVSQDLVSWGFV